uniref:Bicaudal C-like protein n=1 Tax=Schistosoma mansoni TaxID=6183 RepID=G4LYQ9_SCHMA
MWELIQDLLLQFTNNKICEINNSSCLNSSALRIQTQRLWSDDIPKPNEESTKILSSKNKYVSSSLFFIIY